VKLACVIPVYNEEGSLLRLLSALDSLVKKDDIIVVDDGSEDRSPAIISRCGLRAVRNPKNLGKGMSLRVGFSLVARSDYDAVLTIDADFQHDPRFIPEMVGIISRNDADIVLGTRALSSKKMPVQRIASNKITSLVVSVLTRHRLHDTQSGFRIIRTCVLQNIVLKTSRFETESELLIKALRRGYRVREVPIETVYGGERSSIAGLPDTLRFIRLAVRSLFWFGN
jgi:glycosyltransferase involved in cell wall biosynthesis